MLLTQREMGKSLSLLTTHLFRVVFADGSRARLTLPEVLANLSVAENLVFAALRPHQEPAQHAFLVQLACLALDANEWPDLPTAADEWCRLLRSLTAAWPDDEPWCLVVDDWARPAFLQPPGAAADYRVGGASAQGLDLLVTSKNHDEKLGKLRAVVPDEADVWVYALVSLQGFAGYLGRGNFSTMRMNGGFASRPQFRLVFDEGSGAEFRRDVQALRLSMGELWRDAEAMGFGVEDALELLWLVPWADQALPLSRLHPLCLEVSRRVRLQEAAGGMVQVLTAPSAGMRVAAKDNKGHVLDPWIPIMQDGEKRAFTAQADSFSYHRLAPLLFDPQRCRLPLLAWPTAAERDGDAPALMRMQVLVGGSGRTDGCLRRDLPMPRPVLRRFVSQREWMALRARAFIELAALAQGKVLRAALLQYVDSSDEVNWQNKDFVRAVSPWIAVFERRIDEVFFGVLFETLGESPLDDAAARRRWAACLRVLVQAVFVAAVVALPTRDRSREFARGRAERLLRNGLRVHLADDPPPSEPAAGSVPAGRRRKAVKPAEPA